MPELSRFGGMIIYLLFRDIGSITSRMCMCITENTRQQ